MDGDSGSHTRVSRPFDERVGSIKSIREIWIIVHIPQSIVAGEECDTWWWDLLVGIQIPVVVVDIVRMVVEDVSFVQSEREYRSRESTIRPYLISILIEYDISLRIDMSEHILDPSIVRERPVEERCDTGESLSHFLHTDCPLACRCHSCIYLTRCLEISFGLFEYLFVLYDPVRRVHYPD